MDPELKRKLGPIGSVFEFNENLIFAHDATAGQTFLDPHSFAWVRKLEQQSGEIRAELDLLLQRRTLVPPFQWVSPLQGDLTDDERWRTYFFRVYGWDIPEAKAQCPRTWQAVQDIPGMSLAMFSVLEPGKRVPAHTGIHKGVLRCHLALSVPSSDPSACGIRVKDDIRGWREGRCLVFDDTHEHEAWNDTDEARVVLFIDFARPLPSWLALINAATMQGAKYFSSDVHEARRNAVRFAAELARASKLPPSV